MIPSQEENEPIRTDRIVAVFAFLICCWGVSEFLFPPTDAFYERSIPKLVHAAILLWSGIGIIYDFRTSVNPIRFRNIMVYGGILSVILMLFPMFTFDRSHDELLTFIRKNFYAGCFITQWYVVLLFCAVHLQVNPKAYHTFLKFVPLIVLAFFFAARRHTNLNIAVRSEELQNGIYSGYYLAALYPFAWDIRNKILKVFLILLIIYGTIYSMKRGAMLCLASSLFLSFFSYYLFYASGTKRIPYFFGLSILLGILLLAAAYSISQKEETFSHRMQNIESGSGRINLYKSSWDIFKSLPPEEKIFGARAEENQIRSHNDFLFVLVNFGILGLSVFVLFNAGFAFIAFQAFSFRFPAIPSLVSTLGNIIVIEMISYGLEGHAFMICCIYVGMAQGYLLTDFDDEDEEIEIIEEIDIEEYPDSENGDIGPEESLSIPRIYNGKQL